MNYTIISSIFDIKKLYPGLNRWRSTERYIKLFDYIKNLGIPTVLFIEPHLYDRIIPQDNLYIIKYKLEDLPSYKKIKDLSGLRSVGNGPHVNKEFVSVINDKFYLMNEARVFLESLNLYYPHMIWMDSGIAHLGTISKEQFKDEVNINKDKIVFYLMKAVDPNEIKNLNNHLEYSRGKIAATMSIFPSNLVSWYTEEHTKIFDYTINELKIMCFEEQLMGVIVGMYPDKFDFMYGDYVGLLQNLKYIRTSMGVVISNLIFCREKGLNDIGYKIILKIIDTISMAKTFINYGDFCELCYNAQIICYYMDKILSIYFGNMLCFLYYNTLEGNKYIKNKFDNIKSNLSFVGIDISKEDNFTERKIIELDTYNILWSIM